MNKPGRSETATPAVGFPVDCPVGRPVPERSELRHCDDCGHSGDEGGSTTESYCGACGSTVPYPKEDRCPECGATNCMLIACPECGGRYWEQDECGETPNVAIEPPYSVGSNDGLDVNIGE